MSCQKWRHGLPELPVDEMRWDERQGYLAHLRECGECRQAAVGRDPTVVFSLLPTEEVSDREIDTVRQSVHAMRRMRRLESLGKGRVTKGLVAGAIAAMLLVAVLVIPWRRSPEESSEVPFAGAVGVGSGLVQMPGAPAATASGILQVELRRDAEIERASAQSVSDRLWEIEIPVASEGQVVRHLEGGYRLRFELADGVKSGNIELRDFELLRTGDQGEVSLLAADLQAELNRPMIVDLPGAATDSDSLWLELTWSKTTVASH